MSDYGKIPSPILSDLGPENEKSPPKTGRLFENKR
jgi:hypothetical protein